MSRICQKAPQLAFCPEFSWELKWSSTALVTDSFCCISVIFIMLVRIVFLQSFLLLFMVPGKRTLNVCELCEGVSYLVNWNPHIKRDIFSLYLLFLSFIYFCQVLASFIFVSWKGPGSFCPMFSPIQVTSAQPNLLTLKSNLRVLDGKGKGDCNKGFRCVRGIDQGVGWASPISRKRT